VGEIEYESFSADGAVVTIKGVSIHPGTCAKGKMVNAIHLAAKIIAALPQADHAARSDRGTARASSMPPR
jgi:tripeptide aminopeptidase